MEKNKNHIWYSARFWVILYAIVVTLFLCIQFVLGLLDKFEIKFNSKVLNDFVNGNLQLPITALSYGWTALISIYCCSDRIVDIAKTTKLSVGQFSLGDLSKLRGMILISLILLIVATTFNFIVEKDFDLTAWASAFVITIITYSAGNKAVKASAYFGSHEDQDQNGIPDEAEERFNKWKREQVKNEVETQYITWDYFLDDPENEDLEIKYRPKSVKEDVIE